MIEENRQNKPINKHPTTLSLSSFRYRVNRYIKVRWIYLSILSVSGLITEYISEKLSKTLILNAIVACGILGINGYFQYIAKKQSKKLNGLKVLALCMILADVFAAAFLIYNNGGIEARTIIVFAIPMVAAGAFFNRRTVYGLALLSGILYDTILYLDYYRLIPRHVINSEAIHENFGSVLVATIFYPATFFMVAFVSDYVLTLLNNREAQLQKSTEALNEAQRIAKIGSWEWNIKTNKIIWSPELYRIFKLNPSSFRATYTDYLKRVHAADRKIVNEIVTKALQNAKAFSFDHRTAEEDNEITWVHAEGQVITDDSGQPLKIIGTAQDITERKKSESELAKRTTELEKLNKIMIARELKMIELKHKLKELSK